MIKKILYLLLLFFGNVILYAQEDYSTYEPVPPSNEISKQRNFNEDLSSKYNGVEFQYQEYKPPPKKVKREKSESLVKLFDFISTAFPYVIALMVIFIVVKAVMGDDLSWLKFSKNKKIERAAIFTSEEESYLKSENYSKLIELAKEKGDFRTATRYYYLLLLKQMSNKGLITFDKDKTNTEYIFDLQEKELRKPFSYLLYIYDYVWYGEFVVDRMNFDVIETNYESFLKKLS